MKPEPIDFAGKIIGAIVLIGVVGVFIILILHSPNGTDSGDRPERAIMAQERQAEALEDIRDYLEAIAKYGPAEGDQ